MDNKSPRNKEKTFRMKRIKDMKNNKAGNHKK